MDFLQPIDLGALYWFWGWHRPWLDTLMLNLTHLGDHNVLLVVGPDDQSVRAFRNRIPGVDNIPDFYRLTKKSGALLMDGATGSEWNFQGCALSGKAQGLCLERIPVIKDYWFDWRNYNPKTTIYGRK